ncbi:gluconokinase [Rhodopseudomonas palustris]|uniref:Gluconokinase n=2 Tax=Rhodopseudomonas palustris TaxID=1076 RepID=A0A418VG81_RHOPL|nr:gluconokinase [Rhodopseudomonas palustris]RJF75103.1 gluconokinase [Rhodopseudomonas palustris]
MTADEAPRALIVMGVSGSGKTSVGKALAERLGWSYEDADDFHPPANVAKMSAGHPLNDDDRWPWLRAIAAEIDKVADGGGRVVFGCSALKRSYRDVLVHGRADTRIVYLDGSRETIAARIAARHHHFMPPGLLDSQFATLEPPGADEQPIVVGIDNTIEQIVDGIVAQLPVAAAPRDVAE